MGQKRQRSMKSGAAQQTPKHDESRSKKPHALEWVVGGLSALVVLAIVGFILYHALNTAAMKPELRVLVEQVEATDNGFRVDFRAVNGSDVTAAGVEIEGRIERDAQTIETSGVTIDYIPAHSGQRGGLLFSRDPSRYRLRLVAKGYTDP
ncbi:TIGR02588 family protein [Chelativorans salis]|uniref:TIGR02588 family protein n=1 Tax=Chelativorans salis TaxID=2978478 RepID=A0ABT2LVA0_9HYPH|nr:TIGR02588 family protein [Chelativorans sp. EGI FJ00035]MCT7378450.1 TIGR02588 family protein [Chelativorans sp. EGI FJ00035]